MRGRRAQRPAHARPAGPPLLAVARPRPERGARLLLGVGDLTPSGSRSATGSGPTRCCSPTRPAGSSCPARSSGSRSPSPGPPRAPRPPSAALVGVRSRSSPRPALYASNGSDRFQERYLSPAAARAPAFGLCVRRAGGREGGAADRLRRCSCCRRACRCPGTRSPTRSRTRRSSSPSSGSSGSIGVGDGSLAVAVARRAARRRSRSRLLPAGARAAAVARARSSRRLRRRSARVSFDTTTPPMRTPCSDRRALGRPRRPRPGRPPADGRDAARAAARAALLEHVARARVAPRDAPPFDAFARRASHVARDGRLLSGAADAARPAARLGYAAPGSSPDAVRVARGAVFALYRPLGTPRLSLLRRRPLRRRLARQAAASRSGRPRSGRHGTLTLRLSLPPARSMTLLRSARPGRPPHA